MLMFSVSHSRHTTHNTSDDIIVDISWPHLWGNLNFQAFSSPVWNPEQKYQTCHSSLSLVATLVKMLLPWKPWGGGGKKRCSWLYGDNFIVFADISSPLTDAFSSLEEASVVRLLERLVGLCDEGRGPLDALLAAGYLLGELPQPHGLGRRQRTR